MTFPKLNRRDRRHLASGLRRQDPRLIPTVNELEQMLHRADDAEYVTALEVENRHTVAQMNKMHDTFERSFNNWQLYQEVPEYAQLALGAKLAEQRAEALEVLRVDIPDLPRNLPEVVQLVERLYPDGITFTDDARASAEDAAFQDPWVSWRLLRALATVLPDLLGQDVDIPTEFKSRTGFELAFSEGCATKHDARLMRSRTTLLWNRTVYESGHIKYGNKPPKLLRVHFAIETFSAPIIVTHCGDHLKTAGTRRKT